MTHTQASSNHSQTSFSYRNLLLWFRAVGAGIRKGLHLSQTARMMQALNTLSDTQLAEIGIERRDIPDYAERLMSDDPDAEND